ncbi:hypothetical protein [Pontibacillus halophilus]|uniref:hypothetical protein n=1 Tax=Pontibacillus halophilus TaxID=516704 RepID=UPI0004097A27|nr:hypothetical protein [Pontibacillus halophilus]
MDKKKLLLALTFISVLNMSVSNLTPNKEGTISAKETKTVTIYKKVDTINWNSSPSEVKFFDYPQSAFGNYDDEIEYESDGFTGTLLADGMKVEPNNTQYKWKKNRTKTITEYQTSDWVYRDSQLSFPNSVGGTYYDNKSGKNVDYVLMKKGGTYQVNNEIRWTQYISRGRAENYDKNYNNYLGYMSNNAYGYYKGSWYDPRPAKPDQFYGEPFILGLRDWNLVDWQWDEGIVRNADTWASYGNGNDLVYTSGSYWWKSEKGVLNKYRRGVELTYNVKINMWKYRQKYERTINLPDYVDYTYSDNWDVYVKYTGTVTKPNLSGGETLVMDNDWNEKNVFEYGERIIVQAYMHADAPINQNINHTHILNGRWQGKIRSVDYPMAAHRWITKGYENLPPGDYEVQAYGDYYNKFDESNEYDNLSDLVTFTVKKPNLYGEETLAFDESGNEKYVFDYGEDVIVKAKFSSDTPIHQDINFTHSKGVKWQGKLESSGYDKPGSKWITKTYSNLSSGTHVIKGIGDYYNKLPESSEYDNFSDEATITIRPSIPTADFVPDPNPTDRLTEVDITDKSSDPEGHALTHTYHYRKLGTSTWKFMSNDANPSHTFDEIGEYEVKLDVVDTQNATDSVIKTVIVNNIPPEANFDINPNPTDRITETSITNKATDSEDDDLEYKYLYRLKGTSSWTEMSTASEPNHTFDELGVYEVKQVVTDVYNDSDSIVKEVVVENIEPEITMEYNPDDVYEGDDVKVCVVPTDDDGDPLDVEITLSENGSTHNVIHAAKDITSGTEICTTIPSIDEGSYEVTGTVDDGNDEETVTLTFEAEQLTLKGYVKHTQKWQEKHDEKGNLPDQYYSGEGFVLEADTSEYPVDYVTSEFSGYQLNGNLHKQKEYLSSTLLGFHEGLLFNPKFQNGNTVLKNGQVQFDFEVRYTNGTIKQDTVNVDIIGDVFDVFQMRKKY